MSRISADECLYIDMEWYGVDRQGNIAVFCSAGEGFLPEFVCEDRERAEALIEYFAAAEKITGSLLLRPKTEQGEETARDFSDRGLYYFDADDGTRPGLCTLHTYYTKQSCPQKPLQYKQLPEHIRELLKHNLMETEDFSIAETIQVQHAYP